MVSRGKKSSSSQVSVLHESNGVNIEEIVIALRPNGLKCLILQLSWMFLLLLLVLFFSKMCYCLKGCFVMPLCDNDGFQECGREDPAPTKTVC